MRLNRSYLVLGTFVVALFGSMFLIARQKRVGFRPLIVGEPKQESTHQSNLAATQLLADQVSENASDTESIASTQDKNEPIQSQSPFSEDWSQLTTAQMQSRADQAISEARYEYALQQLREVLKLQGNSINAKVLFKLGVCYEVLQDDPSALNAYHKAISSTHKQPLLTAARLGACRIWSRTGKAEQARDELYSMLLNHRTSLSDATEQRIKGQLALSSAKCCIKNQTLHPILSDETLHIPMEELSAELILKELESHSLIPSTVEDQPSIVQNILKLDDSVDSIIIEASSKPLTINLLLNELCRSADLNLSIEEEIEQRLDNHITKVSFRGIPFSILLDTLLVPMDLNWKQEGKTISVFQQSELQTAQIVSRAMRLLEFAISTAPEHSLVPICQNAHAALKQQMGEYERAHREYERILSESPNVPFANEIWMNIAKCRLKLNQENAGEAFYSAVDLGMGGEVDAIAYAFVGRIYLTNNRPQKALISLSKAEGLTTNQRLLNEIKILQSAAYYLDHQLNSGLKKISSCSESHFDENQKNQFTVLATLLKQGSDQENEIRDRDAVLLLAALANLQEQNLFGEHWTYLQIRAYQLLGLTNESERILAQMTHNQFHAPIIKESKALLQLQTEGWLKLSEGLDDSSSVSDEAFIRYCNRRLKMNDLSDFEKLMILRQLGSVYQKRGHHSLAIQCFTDDYSVTDTSPDLAN